MEDTTLTFDSLPDAAGNTHKVTIPIAKGTLVNIDVNSIHANREQPPRGKPQKRR